MRNLKRRMRILLSRKIGGVVQKGQLTLFGMSPKMYDLEISDTPKISKTIVPGDIDYNEWGNGQWSKYIHGN